MNELSFFDTLENLLKEWSSKKPNVDVKPTMKDYDLTTDEGYGEFMKFLGDLRIKAEKYNGIFSLIFAENVSDVIDRVAQEATDQHEAAKKMVDNNQTKKAEEDVKKTEDIVVNIQPKDRQKQSYNTCTIDNNDNKVVNIAKEHKCNCQQNVLPSDCISDKAYDSICEIVRRYMDEYYSSDEQLDDWLEPELIEFCSWLHQQ